MKRTTLCLAFLILVTACGPIKSQTGPATTTPEVFNPLPADQRAFEAARADLAKNLGIDPLSITLVEAAAVDWPDSCLGLGGPNEACAQLVTPGFRVRIQADGVEYEYHTNLDASSIRQVP